LLYREFARLEITSDPITAALQALVTSQPKDLDYLSLWPSGTKINSVTVSEHEATIDLTFGKLNVGAEGEALAIAQLVWTATAADPSVTTISLTVDGKKVESLAGHVDSTQPFTRAPSYEVLAPVWITSPAEGDEIGAQGFTLRGLASTFEANVVWRVFQNGKLVRQGFTTALEAAPAREPWIVVIDGLAPGEYEFAAMEFSAKDGSLVAQDTKSATLT
ncbi:MAG: Gmad2 immunoglobulin-like domain-containing protein, partial [Actinomycetota bacterium]